jgi:hypothetical protein
MGADSVTQVFSCYGGFCSESSRATVGWAALDYSRTWSLGVIWSIGVMVEGQGKSANYSLYV